MLQELPLGKTLIDGEWVYKTKYNADGSLDKYKGRLVSKGLFSRKKLTEETFTPTTKLVTIRFVTTMVAFSIWKMY